MAKKWKLTMSQKVPNLSRYLCNLLQQRFVIRLCTDPIIFQKLSVSVSDAFDWMMEEPLPPRQQCGKRPKRESLATRRESIFSSTSSAANSSAASQHECAFRIEVYWGEECQRQRLKWLALISSKLLNPKM